MADPLIGRAVGEYQVTARLGHAEAKLQYRVRHRKLRIERAMQVVVPAVPEAAKLVLSEAHVLGAIRHKNVIRAHDAGELGDGTFFILTELLNGETLAAVSRRDGPMAVREVLKIFRYVAEGLAEAHDRKIVHRAIDPENIFIAREGGVGVAKLINFGLGLPYSRDGVQRVVGTGVYPGGARYAAVEQIGHLSSGEGIDSRADVYSLGLCMYKALTGQGPFQDQSPTGSRDERLRQPLVAPSEILGGTGIEPELDELILRMSATDRDRRPAGGREVALELDGFLLGVRRPGRVVVPAETRRSEPSSRAPAPAPQPAEQAVERREPGRDLDPRSAASAAAAKSRASAKAAVGREAAPVPAPPSRTAPPAESRSAATARTNASPAGAAGDPVLETPLARATATASDTAVVDRQFGASWNPTAPAEGRRASAPDFPVVPVIVGVVGILVLCAIFLVVRSFGDRKVEAVTVPTVITLDRTTLDDLVAAGDPSGIRGWLRSYPRSVYREDAYLALGQLGSDMAIACELARDDSPRLLEGDGRLAKACR